MVSAEFSEAHGAAETPLEAEPSGLDGWTPPPDQAGGQAALSLAPNATTVHSSMGRQLQVLCGLERILNVRGGAQVATRVTPTVIDVESGRRLTGRERTKLDAPDFLAIDRVVLRAALPLLEKNLDWPVIVPMSFYTISRTRARVKLFKSLGLKPEHTQHVLIGEIVGVDKGTPESRLTDSVSLIRPYCCAVFVEALTPASVKGMANSRIAGASLDCRDLRRSEEALSATLFDFGETGAAVARTLIVRGLPADSMMIAQAAGITHVSMRGEAASSEPPEDEDEREAA